MQPSKMIKRSELVIRQLALLADASKKDFRLIIILHPPIIIVPSTRDTQEQIETTLWSHNQFYGLTLERESNSTISLLFTKGKTLLE